MTSAADSLRAVCARISRWFAWGGGALILASAVPITLDVMFRNLTKSTFFESFEAVGLRLRDFHFVRPGVRVFLQGAHPH